MVGNHSFFVQHTHALIHTWVRENTLSHTYTYIYMHTHVQNHMHIQMYVHVSIQAHIYVNIFTHYSCMLLGLQVHKNRHNLREGFPMIQGQEDRVSWVQSHGNSCINNIVGSDAALWQ